MFYNGSKYGYQFIIKAVAKEFKGGFEYLEENTERYTNFLVPIKKKEIKPETTTYTLTITDGIRFMNK